MSPIKRRRTAARAVTMLAGLLLVGACSSAAPAPPSTSQRSAGSSPSAPATASAAAGPANRPVVVDLLAGFGAVWRSSGQMHGTVRDAAFLRSNDLRLVWINRHATAGQVFRALQDNQYGTGAAYDQSITIADGLGSVLGPLYVRGRHSAALRLVGALVSTVNGSAGTFANISAAKDQFDFPRPFVPVDPGCGPVNSSSLVGLRRGAPYADAQGDLKIRKAPDVVDRTHRYSTQDIQLGVDYAGLCRTGSFPSGHSTSVYQAGITLATFLPALAPEILARASEAANNRLVLGVHYPADVIGGRIAAEAAIAARWSEPNFRRQVLEPARRELVDYLQHGCRARLPVCIGREKSYHDDPYGGAVFPGGSSQTVTTRASAVAVFTQRLTYGLPLVGRSGRAASVPADASNLLLTTFPTLTAAQRTEVLAQTEIGSGNVLDQSPAGSWERLDLAAAMSARVVVGPKGRVRVTRTGGSAQVVRRP